jgi:UDP-N-acetylmuramoyl-tripeptide--D-alanyl-D-alanine ligase
VPIVREALRRGIPLSNDTQAFMEAVPCRTVGITGSAGKTTTKELIAAALSARHAVQSTRGSLNNETGVPLTLLGLMPHHDAAVIEMGMRGLGQIGYLAGLAMPAVSAVLNAGTAHIGVVGSADGIVQGKSEIFSALGDGGTAVFPADDPRLAARAAGAPRQMRFGGLDHDLAAPPEVAAVDYALVRLAGGALGAEITFSLHGAAAPPDGANRVVARLALVGQHNATNAACALACAIAAGVPAAAAARALSRARPPALRGQIRVIAGRHVLVDCYNANPASMRVALATVDELARTHGGRAIAVLGDMLELGDEAPTAHAEIGREAAGRGIAVIAVGEHGPALAGGATPAPGAMAVSDVEAAAAAALAGTASGDWILVKASRGIRLERVVEAMQRLAANHVETPAREA